MYVEEKLGQFSCDVPIVFFFHQPQNGFIRSRFTVFLVVCANVDLIYWNLDYHFEDLSFSWDFLQGNLNAVMGIWIPSASCS
jgi:hypothetical protein